MEEFLTDTDRTELGKIQIAPEVLEVIAGMAAAEVEGVAQMSGGLVGDIAERLGRKNIARGVRVEVGTREAAVDVSIIVKYGHRIPEVARLIQDSVRNAIETMTGLSVVEVNVHIVDVELKSEEKAQPVATPGVADEYHRVR
ncbi:Asp23/Gls24 family envelope stress response protein [Brevibacillus fluminis]|uniref:Asp23/Gls24 family envelope stress response protein n=1 Tax=Brevibacillus fluminis TaxID=511487 RepID=A0A3M8CZJ5_9BACL|nr:Asp23/Gls24 family envelope stress response protein [Brevibacillus fluminis]RNB81143.1 Asp23/Gls24 family envelope stress response protein [Brevibacillus fluminis]